VTGLFSKLRRREPVAESPCPRCGVLTPVDADECTACGWDLRESYHGPVGGHELPSDRRSDD
jgi:predicted RNA-binding Zn-ribbon protein involved in translation (DUF1610 family)